MTRPRKVQLDISSRVPNVGRTVRRWPISTLGELRSPGAHLGIYVTIADVVQARKPEVGAVYVVIEVSTTGEAPTYAAMLDAGSYCLIGHYTSAAERRALLQGERIDDGEQK